MTNVFSGYADLSNGMFGVLLIVVMMVTPGGIVGTCVKLFADRKARIKGEVKPVHWGKA